MKQNIVIYVDTPEISEAVQNLAFKHGFTWISLIVGSHRTYEVSHTSMKGLEMHCGNKEISYVSNPIQDFDASTEFGKIVEWFTKVSEANKSKELERENERLKQEIQQLRDDLEHKEESFPEGYDWHNPDRLTASMVGVKDGWRLLLESEILPKRKSTKEIQRWTGNDWDNTGWGGHWEKFTYRVKWPIPYKPEPVTDDFPTPEKQEKEAGVKWFLNYLKCCKEVHGWVSGKPREVEVNFGKCGGGAKLVLHGEDICLQDNYGDTHRIAITKIIP